MSAALTLKAASAIAGSLGKPSKMPGYAYGIPAKLCKLGGLLQAVKNSVCAGCYALGANYQYPSVKISQQRRFESLGHPRWVDAMVHLIGTRCGKLGVPYFRWHDSGDLQSAFPHLARIAEVCRRLPDIKFWLPTRERAMVLEYLRVDSFPENLSVRLSATMLDRLPVNVPDGCTGSMVRSHESPAVGTYTCPAPRQDGHCGDCRACWTSTPTVSYHKH